jgi:hypothetical protein
MSYLRHIRAWALSKAGYLLRRSNQSVGRFAGGWLLQYGASDYGIAKDEIFRTTYGPENAG